jgi:hypothetical protein
VRLRQAVLAARDIDRARTLLEGAGLRDPFVDPGVKEFGLTNAVYPVGDAFLEVVSPIQDGTTAGRYLERRDAGDEAVGYMVIVQVDDLDAVRARAESLGIRTVWTIDLDDISASHLHPRDVGAILSVDQPVPPSSWRWGGPGWEERAVPGRLVGMDVAGADAERWAALLDRPLDDDRITFDDDTWVRFVDGGTEGVVRIELDVGTANVVID